jgi:hypothetical protein
MTLSSLVKIDVQAAQTQALDLGTASFNLARTLSTSFANGTAAGQADRLFSDTRTIAASGTDDLDLNGVLADALGATLAILRVKALVVVAAAGNSNDVLVGGAPTNGFVSPFNGATHQARVRPGGFLAWGSGVGDATGFVVTAATADILRITNSGAGTPVTYDIIVIGASA